MPVATRCLPNPQVDGSCAAEIRCNYVRRPYSREAPFIAIPARRAPSRGTGSLASLSP